MGTVSAPEQLDPRVATLPTGDGTVVAGSRCGACDYVMAFGRLRCPRCAGSVVDAEFGPAGTVWASTVVRVPVHGRTPPYALAYVDLDDGPRVLAHVAEVPGPLPVGTRVRLEERTQDGDLQVVMA